MTGVVEISEGRSLILRKKSGGVGDFAQKIGGALILHDICRKYFVTIMSKKAQNCNINIF